MASKHISLKKQNPKTIMLINPPLSVDWNYAHKGIFAPPLGLLLVATILKNNGFDVKIIDGAYHEDYLTQIKTVIKNDAPLFVGVSVETTQIPLALKVASVVRKYSPKSKIVFGGMHPTLFPKQTVKHKLVDIVAINEAEFTCLELAQALAT